MNYAELTRKELQKLAKDHGIKANMKSADIIAALEAHDAAQQATEDGKTASYEAEATVEEPETSNVQAKPAGSVPDFDAIHERAFAKQPSIATPGRVAPTSTRKARASIATPGRVAPTSTRKARASIATPGRVAPTSTRKARASIATPGRVAPTSMHNSSKAGAGSFRARLQYDARAASKAGMPWKAHKGKLPAYTDTTKVPNAASSTPSTRPAQAQPGSATATSVTKPIASRKVTPLSARPSNIPTATKRGAGVKKLTHARLAQEQSAGRRAAIAATNAANRIRKAAARRAKALRGSITA
jgi:hypothetical protein